MKIATWIFSIASAVLSLIGVFGLFTAASLMGSGTVLLVGMGALAWFGRSMVAAEDVMVRPFRYTWVLAGLCAVALALTAASVASFDLPHGDWDAWSIWNLRAKFLAAPENWRHAVSPLSFRSHPDYPLLTPAVAAHFSPALLAMIFFGAVAAVLISTVALLRGAASGWLAGLAFAASAGYITQAPSQYADIPLSAFVLCALASLWQPKHPFMLFGAGLFAGFAAFTKNEGIVFAVALLGVVAVMWRAAILPVLCGALPGLATTAWFKFAYAPPSEYLSGSFQPGRLIAIFGEFFNELWNMGIGAGHPLLVLGVLGFGLRFSPVSRIWKIAAAVVGIQIVSYFGAYLVTPNDFKWQLGTSMNRLLAQVWPSILLLFFMALTPPESQPDNLEKPARPPKPAGSRDRRRGG
jgi:hypothetical protein